MKKIISLLLCMALVIAFPAVMSAQEIDETAKMQEITTVLTKLGIVDETASEGNMSALVTRAEFVSYAAALIKLDKIQDKRYFNDVADDHWALGDINSMVGIGAISLADDGKFNPDDKVTYEQACKILMVTAGYREYAAPGYTLTDYIQLAHGTEIGISCSAKEELTFGATLELLYNTLTAKMAKYNSVSSKDETILSLYHSGYTAVGTVDSVFGFETDKQINKAEQAYISGELFVVSDVVALEDYFGETIKFTYIEDKRGGSKEIIYAKPKYNGSTIEIQSDLIKGFDKSARRLAYYADEDASKSKTVQILQSAVYVYNGRLMQGSFEDKIREFINGTKKGTIKLIERSGSGIDFVVIKSYETYIAKAYDTENNILYNEYDKDKNIDLEAFDIVRIRSKYENNVSLPTVFPDALSVAVSEDNRVLEIYLTEEHQKKVNVLTAETVILDDEEYDIDKFMLVKFSHALELNSAVNVKVDIFGDIVYAEKAGESTGFQLGYITKMYFTESDTDDTLTIRVYRKDKLFTAFEIKEKVVIDGVRYKTEDVKRIVDAFPGMNSYDGKYKIQIEPQIIRFKVNAENIVKEIDTYNVVGTEDKNYTLTRTTNGESLKRYWGADKRYGELDIVDSNTLILSVPTVDANGLVTVGGKQIEPTDNMYNVGATVSTDYTYYVEAYYYTNRFIADALLVKAKEDKMAATLCMFDELNTVWDESAGELKVQFIGYSKGGKVVYTLTDDAAVQAKSLNRGDIVRPGTIESDNSLMTTFKKIFDTETMNYVGSTSSTEHLYVGTDLRSTYNLAKMFAYDTRGNILRGSYKLYDAADDIANMAVNAGTTAIIVYDKELKNDKIFQGTINDIKTYKMYGEGCDMILYNTAGVTSPVVFVVRR